MALIIHQERAVRFSRLFWGGDSFKLIFSGCSVKMFTVHSVEHNVFTFLLCFYRFILPTTTSCCYDDMITILKSITIMTYYLTIS